MNDNMPENVIALGNVTRLDIPADRVLTQAIGKLEGVLIVGYDKEGDEFFASSYADGGTPLWLMERCKLMLLRCADDE